jgi:hypothetical protein
VDRAGSASCATRAATRSMSAAMPARGRGCGVAHLPVLGQLVESNRAQQYQLIVPSVPTSATVVRHGTMSVWGPLGDRLVRASGRRDHRHPRAAWTPGAMARATPPRAGVSNTPERREPISECPLGEQAGAQPRQLRRLVRGPVGARIELVDLGLYVDEPAGEFGRDGECEPGCPCLRALDRGGERVLSELPADRICARDDGRRTGTFRSRPSSPTTVLARRVATGWRSSGRSPALGVWTTSTVPSASR